MLAAVRPAFLSLLLVALALPGLAESTEYRAAGDVLLLRTEERLERVPNPHAILSLRSEEEVVILVTTQARRFTLTQLYDGLPSVLEEEATCLGRVLLSVDGEDVAAFLVEGMFPPEQEATHNTLYAVANRGEAEYTFMIHFPRERGDEGFEWAAGLLGGFRWGKEIVQ